MQSVSSLSGGLLRAVTGWEGDGYRPVILSLSSGPPEMAEAHVTMGG